jgi:hypothetical protein
VYKTRNEDKRVHSWHDVLALHKIPAISKWYDRMHAFKFYVKVCAFKVFNEIINGENIDTVVSLDVIHV